MKRAWLLLTCFGMTGCIGFTEYYLDDPVGYEYVAQDRCSCPTTSTPSNQPNVSTGSGVIPASGQTREPDLLTPPR